MRYRDTPKTAAVKIRKTTAKTEVRRKLREPKRIADTAYRMEKLRVEVFVDLIPEPMHQHVYHIRLGIEMVVPHVFHDHGLGNHLTGVSHKILEERKLPRLQLYRGITAGNFPSHVVQAKVPDFEHGRGGLGLGTANEGLHPHQELGE
jgi:hypothetical protein